VAGVPLLGGGGEAKREKMLSAKVVELLLSFSNDDRGEFNEYERLFGRGELSDSPLSKLPESNCEQPCALCRLEGDMVLGRNRRGLQA